MEYYLFVWTCISSNLCRHMETLPFQFQVEKPRLHLELWTVGKFTEKEENDAVKKKNKFVAEDLDCL